MAAIEAISRVVVPGSILGLYPVDIDAFEVKYMCHMGQVIVDEDSWPVDSNRGDGQNSQREQEQTASVVLHVR